MPGGSQLPLALDKQVGPFLSAIDARHHLATDSSSEGIQGEISSSPASSRREEETRKTAIIKGKACLSLLNITRVPYVRVVVIFKGRNILERMHVDPVVQ